jgi:8-oxo-dGTP pyrophosphatase MutT (NUDIX family)
MSDWSAEIITKGSVTVAIECGGKFLLNLRDDKPWIWAPNCWSLVGGQIEEGEYIAAAACREILEETGIMLPPTRLLAVALIRETKGEGVQQTAKLSTLFLYRAKPEEFDGMVCGEGVSLAWVTIEEIVNGQYRGRQVIPAHYEGMRRCH